MPRKPVAMKSSVVRTALESQDFRMVKSHQDDEERRHERRKDEIWAKLMGRIGRELIAVQTRHPHFRMLIFTVPEITLKFSGDTTSREVWSSFRNDVAAERRRHMRAMGWRS